MLMVEMVTVVMVVIVVDGDGVDGGHDDDADVYAHVHALQKGSKVSQSANNI